MILLFRKKPMDTALDDVILANAERLHAKREWKAMRWTKEGENYYQRHMEAFTKWEKARKRVWMLQQYVG